MKLQALNIRPDFLSLPASAVRTVLLSTVLPATAPLAVTFLEADHFLLDDVQLLQFPQQLVLLLHQILVSQPKVEQCITRLHRFAENRVDRHGGSGSAKMSIRLRPGLSTTTPGILIVRWKSCMRNWARGSAPRLRPCSLKRIELASLSLAWSCSAVSGALSMCGWAFGTGHMHQILQCRRPLRPRNGPSHKQPNPTGNCHDERDGTAANSSG